MSLQTTSAAESQFFLEERHRTKQSLCYAEQEPEDQHFKNRTESRTKVNLKKIYTFRHVALCSQLVVAWLHVLNWRWRQCSSLNVNKLLNSVTFQNILFFHSFLILLNVFAVSFSILSMQVACTFYITFHKSMSTVATIIIFMTSHHTSYLSNLKAYWTH